MYPIDEYTPHGYLDNPAHAWKVPGPGGVLRSRPAIGMGWHFPSFAHSYNRQKNYICNLQIGLKLPNGAILLDSEDFKKAGVKLTCNYHSKNLLRYELEIPSLSLKGMVQFFLSDSEGGNALSSTFVIDNIANIPQKISVIGILDYEANLGQGLKWESGMFARSYSTPPYQPDNSEIFAAHTIGVYQEGTHFHLGIGRLGSTSTAEFKANSFSNLTSLESVRDILQGKSPQPNNLDGRLVGFSEIEIGMKENANGGLILTVGRGESEKQAIEAAIPSFAGYGFDVGKNLSEQMAKNRIFWRNAPQLSGDWPDHVRRGLVYDFETMRMMVRRPMGIYQNRWDAMQLQVPRTVLAEAALDMLIFSYADPAAAKEVLYGTFADSPEPNIPCSREDGSYNMIALDGTPCGTAPEWCFPFHCINLVYKMTGDKEWLGKLYPYLEDYIGFWITKRVNAQGRPYYKCSWEAGQDNSPRFGIKDDPSGGGAITEHIWPVDLQAALAQSCRLLAEWAIVLGQDAPQWAALGERFTQATQQLWHNNWFHDFDMAQNQFTNVLDTMQFAPLLCRAATPDQVAALMPRLENPPKHGNIFHPLMWPSVAFCLIEACSESQRLDLASWHSWQIIDPVYRWLDSNPADIDPEKGGMPGVAREYWPQVVASNANPPRGGGGAEVYGWGCLSVYLLLRYVVGFAGENDGFTVTPNLPADLLQPGKVYKAGQFSWHQAKVDITYTVGDKLAAKVELFVEQPSEVKVVDGAGKLLYTSPISHSHSFQLNISNGTGIKFLL